jgi:tRNA threonylcarbamoyl adenosine modification protein (Sua5/YciO/YrdC/YwlC family)
MERVSIHPENPQTRVVEKAVKTLRDGGVVLMPGDTSYFLAIKIGKKNALDKLNRIKQTKKRKYYSLLFRDLSEIAKYTDLDNKHFNLLKRCLPGPYTFILNASKDIPKIMLQNRKEVGIRIPESKFTDILVEMMGEPIVVSTATSEDGTEFNDPDDDSPDWLGYVDLMIDGGYVHPELTTIIRLNEDEYEVLREGKGTPEIF